MITDVKDLADLGFGEGINEIIAVTERNGIPNAAPIGIIKDGEKITIRLFSGTHTFENILETGSFTANVTHDAMVFAESALADMPGEFFERRDGVLTMKDAESWALFKCDTFRLDIIIAEVRFVKGEVLRREFRACNRGVNLVVEAAIDATRYLALNTECYMDDIRKLDRIIRRCGGQRERQAMDKLWDLLESYRPL
jgi:uncharacterized protein